MEIHAHGFLLLGVFFWRGLSRILRGILRLSISGSQPLVIDLRHWPQIWRRAKNNPIAFEVLMVLAVAHLFGFYNPKQLADFLEVPHQQFSTELKDWSVYHVKKMLLRFMVKQAAEHLKPVMSKSAATRSRAGMTLSIDNSGMDRLVKLLRCAWNWYSGC